MADFSFGFTEGSFLRLNDQKTWGLVAEDLISNNWINLSKPAKARTL